MSDLDPNNTAESHQILPLSRENSEPSTVRNWGITKPEAERSTSLAYKQPRRRRF